jgi:hypothetical protein
LVTARVTCVTQRPSSPCPRTPFPKHSGDRPGSTLRQRRCRGSPFPLVTNSLRMPLHDAGMAAGHPTWRHGRYLTGRHRRPAGVGAAPAWVLQRHAPFAALLFLRSHRRRLILSHAEFEP